jgi:hypothetical protein
MDIDYLKDVGVYFQPDPPILNIKFHNEEYEVFTLSSVLSLENEKNKYCFTVSDMPFGVLMNLYLGRTIQEVKVFYDVKTDTEIDTLCKKIKYPIYNFKHETDISTPKVLWDIEIIESL